MVLAPLFFLQNVEIRWVDDEAKAAIVAMREPARTADIERTEGYVRLQAREMGMGREFTFAKFTKCIVEPRSTPEAFEACLAKWSQLDFNALGERAATYLPGKAKIHASVYPLIKPSTNSFVWDVPKRPAIMLYLDPSQSAEITAMTITHELHHVGYANSCPSSRFTSWVASKSVGVREAWKWVGGFGEGYAVLAASVNKNDPISGSAPEVIAAWNDGMSHLERDFARVESFLSNTATGKIEAKDAVKIAMTFYDVQGPWYTLGYHMATSIETAFGRPALIRCYSEPRLLFDKYNASVAKLGMPAPKWSHKLLRALSLP